MITGKQLRGDVTLVAIGRRVNKRRQRQRYAHHLAVPSDLRAGVQALQVVHQIMIGTPATPHRGVQSNVAAMVLCPRITSVTASGTRRDPQVVPPVGAAQRVALLLNERAAPSPASYTFPAPPRSSDATQSSDSHHRCENDDRVFRPNPGGWRREPS